MAAKQPFDRLIGPVDIYIGPVGETVPDVDTTPAGNWVEVGPTDGGQTLEHQGSAELLHDDDHTGPVKAVRPEEGLVMSTVIVGLTLENYARVLNTVSNVSTDAGPPAIKQIPMKRGYIPNEYAMLLRGEAHSPYGDLPAQYVLPRGFFDGEPAPTYVKDEGAGLEIEFMVLEDDAQATGDEMGYLQAQTS